MIQARLAEEGVVRRVDALKKRQGTSWKYHVALIAKHVATSSTAKQQLSLLTGPPDLNLVPSQSIENWMQQSQK